MNILSKVLENDTLLFYCCSCIIAIYQICLWKKHKFYNFSKEMDRHILSAKYHLNKHRNADLDRINRLLALANISAILLSCMCVIPLGFNWGLISLAVLFVFFNWMATTYLGNYYGYN